MDLPTTSCHFASGQAAIWSVQPPAPKPIHGTATKGVPFCGSSNRSFPILGDLSSAQEPPWRGRQTRPARIRVPLRTASDRLPHVLLVVKRDQGVFWPRPPAT